MNKKLLRKKLALMLANLKKKRPYYCEVEWLKTDGYSYIDTGVSGDNNNLKFDIYFSTTTTDLYSPIFGNAAEESQNNWGIIKGSNNCLGYANTRRSSGLGFTVYKTDDTLNHIIFYRQGNSCIMNVNGTTTSQNATDGTSNNANICIGRAGPTRTPPASRECKHYRFMIYDNGVLVRDFISVLDWDMTPCMYDKVTEQLFYNAGTGDFVAGREIHHVDYLESDSTAYIDTGVSGGNNNLKIEMGFSYSKFYAYGYLFSNYESETSNVTRFCLNGTDTNWGLAYINTRSQNGAIYTPNFTRDTFHTFVLTKTSVSIDGNTATKNNPPEGTENTKNIILFNRGAGTYYEKRDVGMRCYYFRIYDNDVLVRDFIPAIDENGIGYLFDRVSHTIYDNAGTGAFGYSAREVEYIESDGARAIIAGVTVDDTSGYDVKWMALNANDTIIMGTKGSGDSRWVLSGSNNPTVNISWNTSFGRTGLGLNKIQTAQMNYFNDRKRILNDIPLEDITTTLSSAASTYNVGIFGGYWGASTISLYSTCRIYYAKITKGTELIRDFIPMVKDGSPCLYDKIGGLYYFGTGTGTFTGGKIVEPEYE